MDQSKLEIIILLVAIIVVISIYYKTNSEKFVDIDNIELYDLANYYTEYRDINVKREKEAKMNILDKQRIFKQIHENDKLQMSRKQYLDDIISKNKKMQEDKLLSNQDLKDATLVSQYNADNISILPVGDNKFKVLINDKCLTVIGDKNYDAKDCTVGDYAQYFTSRKISDVDEAAYWTDIQIVGTHSYPYHMVQSKISPNHCLNGGDNQLSIEKCDGNNQKQQWQLEARKNICIDTRY
jgi:hypothetical protein